MEFDELEDLFLGKTFEAEGEAQRGEERRNFCKHQVPHCSYRGEEEDDDDL